MKKDLSVIIPVYNVESYIGECLDSIINQTIGIENIEVIIVNDKTPDNSMDIVRQYAEKYSSFKVIDNEVNKGLGESRNIGLKHVTSDYVTFVDSDDFISLNAYEDALNKINEFNVDLLIYTWETYTGNGVVQTNNIHHQCLNENTLIDDINDYPKLFFLTSACDKIYHKSLFPLLKYSKGLYEDNYVTCNVLLNARKIFFSKDSTYYYRKNMESITEKIATDNVFYLCDVICSLCEFDNDNVNLLRINFINDVLFWIYYYDWGLTDEINFVQKLQESSINVKQSDVELFSSLFPDWNFYKNDILNLDNYDAETFLAKYKYYDKKLAKVRLIGGLYIDDGDGFREDCKIDIDYVPKLKNNQLTFDLSDYSDISGLRFDPLEGEFIKARINNVSVIDANCDNSINDEYQYFLTLDPNFILGGEFGDRLMIDFDLEFLTNDELASFFHQKEVSIIEKNNIINGFNQKNKKSRFNFLK